MTFTKGYVLMRKYRAWDKQWKVMSAPMELFRNGQSFFFFKGFGVRCPNHEQIIVMESTDSKDSEGTEIYQDDIMEWHNPCVPKGQNPTCRTMVRWNKLHSRYEGIVRTGTVIGNCHNNPELLEQKE